MAFTYDIETSKKDKGSTISLAVCHLIYKIVQLFISTFLIAHIYTLTSDLYSYAMNVAVYQLATSVCMPIFYFLLSFLVDKTNRVWVYRLANIITAVMVIVAIFYGKDLAKIVVLAGLLNGLSRGAYYASYNVLKQEMVSRKSMDKYAVALMVLGEIVNVVCPILLGALIDISTYSMVAIYVFILNIVLIVVSFFIKSKHPDNSSFNVKDYFKRLKENPKLMKKMKLIYLTCLPYGLTTIVSSLLNINIMIHFGSSFSLGTITSIFAIVSIIILLLLNRFTKAGKRSWMFILNLILPVATGVVFTIVPKVETLIICNLFITISNVISATVYDIYRNKNLKEAGLYQDIAEHQCVVEVILYIVKVISFGLLILVSALKNYYLFQIFFVLAILAYNLMHIILMRYESKEKNDKF